MNETAHDDYELLDSGNGRKLERFGAHVLARPAAGAVWDPALSAAEWDKADAWFDREEGNAWTFRKPLPPTWTVMVAGLKFNLSATAFGHLGIFPEQRASWQWIKQRIKAGQAAGRQAISVLNLFAYSGGSTLAAASAGAQVCHLDASKGMVTRARENAALNGLDSAPVRWIVDDVTKFLDREIRRGSHYDAIILDPPSFGRGKSGEVYKIEKDLTETLGKCVKLLSSNPLFLLLSCHTPAYTPAVMRNLLVQTTGNLGGSIEPSEMLLTGKRNVLPLPSGTTVWWSRS
jgi:23S rRNA (cytosine1962-C5)-methyltransferase